MWKYIVGIVFFVVASVGLGLYVFPEQPWIGWALLFFCWACYRLKMRADRIFGDRAAGARTPSAEEFPVSGAKGGERRTDPTLQRYYEWRGSEPDEDAEETKPPSR